MNNKHNLELTVSLSGQYTENLQNNETLKTTLVEELRKTASKVLLSTSLFVTSVAVSTDIEGDNKLKDVSLGDLVSFRGALYTVSEVGLNSGHVKLTSYENRNVELLTSRKELLSEATVSQLGR